MIATISPSSQQYHHTVNTLKYADRAKEIKTHVRRNQGTVQEHVSKLRLQIAMLQKENADLKDALTAHTVRQSFPTSKGLPYWVKMTEVISFSNLGSCLLWLA